jgi:hypothetical protein
MNTLSTNNWDTAFGIKFKDANQAIVTKSSSPQSFSGTHTVISNTYTVSANFGNWQMNGGSGFLLQMNLPLRSGEISGGSQPDSSFEGNATIQVSLAYIPQPTSSTTNNLKVDLGKPVHVLDVTLTSGPSSAIDSISGALQDWLNGHLQEFNHVFTAVDLNSEVDKGAFSWLKPTHVGYALYTEGFASVDDYIFGVLAMTDNAKGNNLTPVIDPNIIPTNADAGFLISAPRVIEKMFEPHIKGLFVGAKDSDFDTQNDGMTIFNINTLKFTKFILEDGKSITDAHIDADGFNFSIGNGSVVIQFNGLKFTWKEGYDVSVNYQSVNKLHTDKDGHLQLTRTGTPTVSIVINETQEEKWKEIWESIGIGIGVSIVGAVLGGIADSALAPRAARAAVEAGAANIAEDGEVMVEMVSVENAMTPDNQLINEVIALQDAVKALQNPEIPQTFAGFFRASALRFLGGAIGAVIVSSVDGIVNALKAYADQDKTKMPTLDDFASKSIEDTQWPNSSYTLKSAELHGALQMALTKKTP